MSVKSCLNICSFAFRTCHISLSIPLGKGELGKVIKCDIVCVSSIQKITQLSLCRASQPWNCSFDTKFIFCYPLFKRFIQLSWYLFDNHLFAYSKQYYFFWAPLNEKQATTDPEHIHRTQIATITWKWVIYFLSSVKRGNAFKRLG